MDFFTKIQEVVDKKLTEKFENQIKDMKSATREQFLEIYLRTFLGDYSAKDKKDTKFDKYWTNTLDIISLCNPETEFLESMLKFRTKEKYVEGYIGLFKKTKDLETCQLGPLMLKFLEKSKQIKITS